MTEILGVTGHRPDKLGGYGNNLLRQAVRAQLYAHVARLKPAHAISGMALGVDQDFAEVCVELGVPFVAAVPFKGQESRWPEAAQRDYIGLLAKALRVEIICHGGYATWKMQQRNIWIVNNCTLLLAVWDGSDGGTANCVKYAERIGRRLLRINPRHLLDG